MGTESRKTNGKGQGDFLGHNIKTSLPPGYLKTAFFEIWVFGSVVKFMMLQPYS